MAWLLQHLERVPYDVLFPTHDQVFALARWREQVLARTHCALPSPDSVDHLQSKTKFSKLLAALGLPQPTGTIVPYRDLLSHAPEFPLYLKLPYATAGMGTFYIRTRDELVATQQHLERRLSLAADEELLVQQPARGQQATVQAVFRSGELVASHSFVARSVGFGGMSTTRESVIHPAVNRDVRQIGAHLNWHGALFLDYIFNVKTQQASYIEANPRIGEVVNALESGVNLAHAVVRVSLNQPDLVRRPTPGIRTHSGFMVLVSVALHSGRWLWFKSVVLLLTHRGAFRGSRDELTRPRQDILSVLPAVAVAILALLWPQRARRLLQRAIAAYGLSLTTVQKLQASP